MSQNLNESVGEGFNEAGQPMSWRSRPRGVEVAQWLKVKQTARTMVLCGLGCLVITFLCLFAAMAASVADGGGGTMVWIACGFGNLGVLLLVVAQIMYIRSAVERMAER